MVRRRITAFAIAIFAALGAFWCVRDMSARIRVFLEEHPPNIYAFLPILTREFTFADRTVSLTDETLPGKPATLLVRFGDTDVRVPVTIPPRHRLPGLVTHEDWLASMTVCSACCSWDGLRGWRTPSGDADPRRRLAVASLAPASAAPALTRRVGAASGRRTGPSTSAN